MRELLFDTDLLGDVLALLGADLARHLLLGDDHVRVTYRLGLLLAHFLGWPLDLKLKKMKRI